MERSRWKQAEEHLSRVDPVLRELIETLGPCTLEALGPPFDVLCRAVIGQQISIRAARSIYQRLCQAVGQERLDPETVLRTPEASLRQIGLSQTKTLTLRRVAEAICEGRLDLEALATAPAEEVYGRLTAFSGIGRWTVEMVLIFAYLHPRVLPLQDLGLQRAIRLRYNLGELARLEALRIIARPWAPYETIATWYLWKSVDGDPSL
ncbi:MAG: DNA-3-methyladenine glycosylase 2 family protein [Bacteroidetes bacterium]|nr:DNA-3-methyladenine glycosylase 2 family protein [Rhodothermia bacterium]MCS7155820.1 DNA-3-methyladenine glycosylase 2 family protein [Bacteroidota bacterium]MCX7906079.1 DNA-3-methyladenine glycosylase 2 family protein [Bacteroidota bacterium]MDW8138207.1 DNA-3-methyladenine glycosylase 2 family protein [Bacteroidota bacterium]MDW8285891.1 DNA-3-methyladenine glycosylase 2 family protein [Bacteroidota bacterium]